MHTSEVEVSEYLTKGVALTPLPVLGLNFLPSLIFLLTHSFHYWGPVLTTRISPPKAQKDYAFLAALQFFDNSNSSRHKGIVALLHSATLTLLPRCRHKPHGALFCHNNKRNPRHQQLSSFSGDK
jgi:hypothetical protein